ncbi:MAG: hypothetical protein QME05_05245 [Candidatus Margulisbacteria bacterium]|nr:hypothetical protein [Candidatus Margulisiibacteriota bacterium]
MAGRALIRYTAPAFAGLSRQWGNLSTRYHTAVQKHVSPHVTSYSARLGFADRSTLSQQLTSQLTTLPERDQELLTDRLISQRVIKPAFAKQVISGQGIEEHMLSSTITQSSIAAFDSLAQTSLQIDELYASRLAILSSLTTGLVTGCEYVYHQLSSGDSKKAQWALAIGKGAVTAGTIAATIYGFNGLMDNWLLTAGTSIGVLTTLYHDRLDPESKFTGAARFFSRKIFPLFAILSGVHIVDSLHDNNMNVSNMLENSGGLYGTFACCIGLLLITGKYIRNQVVKFKKSYTGQLDSGEYRYRRRLVLGAASSIVADFHFLTAFALLVGTASTFILPAVAGFSTLALLPFALPPLAIIATAYLRGSQRLSVELKDPKLTKLLDHLKMYLPYEALLVGGIASLGVGALGTPFLLPSIAYLTFWGSLATLIASQAHGAGHAINTNMGQLALSRASGRDLVGREEMMELLDGKVTLLENPHTESVDHSAGLTFNLVLARKPRMFILCMYDRILLLPKFLQTYTEEQALLADAANMQNEVFRRLDAGIASAPNLEGAYERYANNLEETARYFDTELKLELQKMMKGLVTISDFHSNLDVWNALLRHGYITEVSVGVAQVERKAFDAKENIAEIADNEERINAARTLQERIRIRRRYELWKDGWFVEEINEYLRAAFEELAVRADEFRQTAVRLRSRVARHECSEDDFQREWEWQAGAYDPEMSYQVTFARKETAGDEWKVRKTENVSTLALMYGLTVYKVWFDESPVYPTSYLVTGTWTRIYNPRYHRLAKPGSMEAAKFLWVKAEEVLFERQRKNHTCLSTSPAIYRMENEPSLTEGYQAGTEDLGEITLAGRRLNISHYYFVASAEAEAIPKVKGYILRDREGGQGATSETLPPQHAGHKVATIDKPTKPEQEPVAFALPYFDYKIMVDKNDIQTLTYLLLAAIVERDKQHLHLNLIYKQPDGAPFELPDPRPDLRLNLDATLENIDANVELVHEFDVQIATGKTMRVKRVIPLLLDRSAAHTGRNDKVKWKDLSGARICMKAGQVDAFILIYGGIEVEMPSSTFPRYFASLDLPSDGTIELGVNNFTINPQREGDMTWIPFEYYTDSSEPVVYFVRVPDGKRPPLSNRDR